ncbi:BREX-1 system phosphatase PglZ type A [Mariniradius sediminis]|uniref:BREX-1 system phosphatase PglZ type A n=1 Tax=Mariniradius sediminis TaxID=2909237 RepID=A0ABS9BV98_9BACT|nr:BREX-1 system phosphatase PglZ type A [Mariniradius sediminis]MCF1751377.1 BREX-1 system phosphatase PglZ type A [Mariniradius sediminis]
MTKIEEGLSRLFSKHRIIVWYDEEKGFLEDFEMISIPSVEKRKVNNNEFSLKYELLIQHPQRKYLLYAPFLRPENEDNWLLDIELSHHVFHTDQEAMVIQELDLPLSFRAWVKRHLEFFKSKERIQKLKHILGEKETETTLTLKLLQLVMGGEDGSIDGLVKAYTLGFLNGKEDSLKKELTRFGLHEPFWSFVENQFNYKSANPSIYDFVLESFQRSFHPLSGKAQVNNSAKVLLATWKDTRSFEESFKLLSDRVQEDLKIKGLLEKYPVEDLIQEDVFEDIDKRIVMEMAQHIRNETLSLDKVESALKLRESKFWYPRYRPFYDTLYYAAQLVESVKKNQELKIRDYEDGFKQYTERWYQMDQNYRLFLQNYRETNQNNALNPLYKRVHKVYSNTWLLRLSDKWQEVIDNQKDWYFGVHSQKMFFKRDIQSPYLEKKTKVFVVISDALRYECGISLHESFQSQTRFTSKLAYQVTGLPSYTQLGMASLLPHKTLSFGDGDEILIDGKSTKGSQPRKAVLQEHSKVRATTILAEDLMKMASKGEEAKTLVQEHDLVYVYHNRIDKVGDDKTQEDKVIEASRDEINFLVELVKKITNMNGNHVVITSDHGFIYQNEVLEESDFSDANVQGDIIRDNRRFVLGRDLSFNNNVVKYSAESLGIKSEVDVLIPKGINRLRKQGSGSRYVHGGSSLQEVVVPVLFIAKKRVDTVSKVDIDVLNKTNNRITTNIHTIKFYQEQPVSESILPRSIKSYFAIIEADESNKKIISDVVLYTFDSESKRAEEREVIKKFTISSSQKSSANTFLVIEEKVEGTNKWNMISKFPYTLKIGMDSDFDDFL